MYMMAIGRPQFMQDKYKFATFTGPTFPSEAPDAEIIKNLLMI